MARKNKEYGPSEGSARLLGLVEAARQIAQEERQRESLNLDLVFPLPNPEIGSTVTVQMYDGRKLQGVVKRIQNTTSGQKFLVVSGDITVKVEAEQILKQQ